MNGLQRWFSLQRDSPLKELWSGDRRAGSERRTRGLRFGFAEFQSPLKYKKHMEDFHVARIQEINNEQVGLFAVMDGHSGPDVASYLTAHLFDAITGHPEFSKDTKKAIVAAYHETDESLIQLGTSLMKLRAGSTATTALLLNNGRHLIVANVGDSRAVLSRGGRAIDISVDHDPQKPCERQMVEAKGGFVIERCGVYRVDARLSMSRSFGDYDIKHHLSVDPDIWDEQLMETDEFFVIASDGVWSVLSSQEVVNLIRTTRGSPKEVAHVVVSTARKKHSTDDILCLIVYL